MNGYRGFVSLARFLAPPALLLSILDNLSFPRGVFVLLGLNGRALAVGFAGRLDEL